MSTIKDTDNWSIAEPLMWGQVWITVKGSQAAYAATSSGCDVRLPPDLIDAIRALPAHQIPHLRQQRERIFSERAKKGWRTRRNENRAQMDADVRTMINASLSLPRG